MINFRYTCVTLNLRQIAWDWGKKEERWFQQGTGGEGSSRGFLSSNKTCHSQSLQFPLMATVLGSTHLPQAFSNLQLRKLRLRGWGSDHRCSENSKVCVPIRSLHFRCCQEGTDNQTLPEEVERREQLQAAGPASHRPVKRPRRSQSIGRNKMYHLFWAGI